MRFYISYITKIGLNVFYEGKKMNLYQQKMKKEARKRIGKERNRTNVLYNTLQEPILFLTRMVCKQERIITDYPYIAWESFHISLQST